MPRPTLPIPLRPTQAVRAKQERREAVVSAVAEAIEASRPGEGRRIAETVWDQIEIESGTRTTREAASVAIYVEIALDFDLGPEDADADLFGPGGWRFDCSDDLEVDGQVLSPEMAGWRRARVPDWPDSEGIAPDWICEIVDDMPQAEQQALRALYARAGVDALWIVDLDVHSISAWHREGDGYRQTGETARTGRAGLAPFETIQIRAEMLGRATHEP